MAYVVSQCLRSSSAWPQLLVEESRSVRRRVDLAGSGTARLRSARSWPPSSRGGRLGAPRGGAAPRPRGRAAGRVRGRPGAQLIGDARPWAVAAPTVRGGRRRGLRDRCQFDRAALVPARFHRHRARHLRLGSRVAAADLVGHQCRLGPVRRRVPPREPGRVRSRSAWPVWGSGSSPSPGRRRVDLAALPARPAGRRCGRSVLDAALGREALAACLRTGPGSAAGPATPRTSSAPRSADRGGGDRVTARPGQPDSRPGPRLERRPRRHRPGLPWSAPLLSWPTDPAPGAYRRPAADAAAGGRTDGDPGAAACLPSRRARPGLPSRDRREGGCLVPLGQEIGPHGGSGARPCRGLVHGDTWHVTAGYVRRRAGVRPRALRRTRRPVTQGPRPLVAARHPGGDRGRSYAASAPSLDELAHPSPHPPCPRSTTFRRTSPATSVTPTCRRYWRRCSPVRTARPRARTGCRGSAGGD